MVADTDMRPKCYTWSRNDFEDGGLQVKDVEYPFQVELSSLSSEAVTYLHDKDNLFVSVITNGDGACGVHAVFGKPSERGELFKECSRQVAATLLGPNPEALQHAGVDDRYIAAIGESLWNEFVKPVLDKKPAAEIMEGLLFWKALQEQKPVLVEQCIQSHTRYELVTKEHIRARHQFLAASHNLFQPDMELLFVRPLAVRLRYLPEGIHNSDLFDVETIAKLRQEHPLFQDWLGSVADDSGYIKASCPRKRFPEGGPCCKYVALFDLQPAYDGLRQSFLQGTHANCEETQTILNSILIEKFDNVISTPNFVDRVIEFMDDMRKYDNASLKMHEANAAPSEFVFQAWQVYLRCMQENSYFFSRGSHGNVPVC